MANSLLITKLSDDSFSFVVNGDIANTIINLRNDLTTVGNECHFKTSEGANLVKLQQILYNEVTIVDGATLPVATSALDLRVKLRSVGFWDWMNSGGSGVNRYVDLSDTLPFFGNNGKVPVVNESKSRLDYRSIPDTSYLNLFPSPLQPLKSLRVNSANTAYEFYDAVNMVTQFIRQTYTGTSPSEDTVFSALALKANVSDFFNGEDFIADGVQASFDLETPAKASLVIWDGSPLKRTDWSQTGTVVTLSFTPVLNALIQII